MGKEKFNRDLNLKVNGRRFGSTHPYAEDDTYLLFALFTYMTREESGKVGPAPAVHEKSTFSGRPGPVSRVVHPGRDDQSIHLRIRLSRVRFNTRFNFVTRGLHLSALGDHTSEYPRTKDLFLLIFLFLRDFGNVNPRESPRPLDALMSSRAYLMLNAAPGTTRTNQRPQSPPHGRTAGDEASQTAPRGNRL